MDNGGVSRGRSVAVGVSDRWKVTCDMWHMTCDMRRFTSDMSHTMIFFLQKVPKKKSKKGPQIQITG